MQKHAAAILMILIASPAFSENDPGTIELTPYGAYSFGGTFNDEFSATEVALQDSGNFGVIFDYKQKNNTQIEVIYSQQKTDADVSGTTIPGVNMRYLQLGGTYLFEEEKVLPFMAATFGATHIDVDSGDFGSDTFFGFSIGAGVQIAPSNRLGVRLEARAFGTLLSSGSTIFCGSGPDEAGCIISIEGEVLWQIQTMLGVVFRFQ